MSDLERILARKVSPIDGGVRVYTDCLHPSGTVVSVEVTGGPLRYVVSDGRSAAIEASSCSLVDLSDKQIAKIVCQYGLRVERGAVFAIVDAAVIAGAVVTVANASQEVARWAEGRRKVRAMIAMAKERAGK